MVLYLDHMYQCELHAVLWTHIGIVMRRLAAQPRSTAGLLLPYQSLWNDLADPAFDGVGQADFKSRANAFYWHKPLYPYYSLLLFFLSLLSVYRFLLWGWGLRTDRVYNTLTALHCRDLLIKKWS